MTNLTEQWKKGELPIDKDYYIKLKSGLILIDYYCQLYDNCHFPNGIGFDSIPENDIVEVLAEVPSFNEWQQMKKWCEEFHSLPMVIENTKLKELLKECREILSSQKMYGIGTSKIWNAVILIDELLGDRTDE